MKISTLFFTIIFSFYSLSMQISPAEHIKKQITQFQKDGASSQEIADLCTNTLRKMLEYPMLYTSLMPYIDLYKTLIEFGGDKNVRHPKNGNTALIFAALDGRADIIKELLNLGLDHRERNNSGLQLADILHSSLSLMRTSDINEIKELITQSKLF